MKVLRGIFLAFFIVTFAVSSAHAYYNMVTLNFEGTCENCNQVTEYSVNLLDHQQIDGAGAYYELPWQSYGLGGVPYDQFITPEKGDIADDAAWNEWIHFNAVKPATNTEWGFYLLTSGVYGYISPRTSPDTASSPCGDGVFFTAKMMSGGVVQETDEPWAFDINSFQFLGPVVGTEKLEITDFDVRQDFETMDGMTNQIITVTFGNNCPEVPIPPSALLLLSGLVGLLWSGRKMRRQ